MMTIRPMAEARPEHFLWRMEGRVGVVTLNRPDKKNPLTFQSYAELRDHFRDLAYGDDVDAVVITGAGGNFCSGGDVFEIIAPLTRMPMPDLIDASINAVLARTIMTSTTTIMALGALALFGGHVIQSFSLSMMFGITIGVYSSIFICAPILIYLGAPNQPEPERTSSPGEKTSV